MHRVIRHDPRCAIFRDPPSLRDPSDCNCGAYGPPLGSQRTPQSSLEKGVAQGQGSSRAPQRRRRTSPATGTSVYAETARILHDFGVSSVSEAESEQVCDLIEEFADWFEADNPRFDRERFLEACNA